METVNQAADECGIVSAENNIFQLFCRLGTCHTSSPLYNPKHFVGRHNEEKEELNRKLYLI